MSNGFRSTLRRFAFGLFTAVAWAAPSRAQSVTLESPATRAAKDSIGRIRGIVFDSLLRRPLARTSVMLLGSGRSTMSDDRGQFSFDDVAFGKHTVAVSMPSFDSLGLGTLGAEVSIASRDIARVTIATPSLRTLWNYRCKANNIVGTDSAIVWGTIRHASDDSLLTGAAAAFEWYDLRPGTILGMTIDEIRRETLTDNSGTYFACGLPDEIVIASEAVGTDAASGRVEYAVGDRRIRRVDLVISTDMVLPDSIKPVTHEDSVRANRPRGRAMVSGRVVDEKGKPLANAIVVVANVDTSVRTNAEGQFRMDGLPSGTHALTVRRVGSAPAQQFLALRSDAVTDVVVVMSGVTTLATVNVKSQKIKGQDRLDYELRRKMGFGYAMDEKEIARRADVYSILTNFPGLELQRSGFGVTVGMRRVSFNRGTCAPAVFLDGLPTPIEFATSLTTDRYRAIEVFTRTSMIPPEYYQPGGCGVLLLWTKQARW